MVAKGADWPSIVCHVVAVREHGTQGFRAVVKDGPDKQHVGPFRQHYVDAVADAQGKAAEINRRRVGRCVAH